MDKVQRINAAYYDKVHLAWAAAKNNSFYQEIPFKKFIKYLKPGNSVLDIGCAYGIHVPLFLGLGRKFKYQGLDISRNMLKLAKSRYPQLSFNYGDIADRKTLPKKKFDAFWAAAVLMHVPAKNWESMLDNIENLVKPDGFGYLTLPDGRPHLASDKDKRHFELFDKKRFPKIAKKRKWKILDSGTMLSSNNVTVWRWYIVKLPKK